MGKVDENKQQKEDALFRSAYNLFMSNGISKTSIHDIVQDAGVAKGTFYLYFKDKFEIRDRLIARTAEKLFKAANTELKKVHVPKFEDKIIFAQKFQKLFKRDWIDLSKVTYDEFRKFITNKTKITYKPVDSAQAQGIEVIKVDKFGDTKKL